MKKRQKRKPVDPRTEVERLLDQSDGRLEANLYRCSNPKRIALIENELRSRGYYPENWRKELRPLGPPP